ncbi:MAG: division/cell wall cluster transcriptional repressor MraZ [Rickettsiales bacterium]|jgi:MraZ protein|nr:division/cell wall cluster transcriptional repressor MraZ [Rickettsiales bacterium]
MALFLSNFENRIDAKGRISVPAAFRSSVQNENFAGVVLYRSFTDKCIEGVTMSRMEKMAAAMDNMGAFDASANDLSAMVFADARQLMFDVAGRVIIPADMLAHAGITDAAVFVGRGNTFQIWEPAAFRAAQNKSLKKLQSEHPNFVINPLSSARGNFPSA